MLARGSRDAARQGCRGLRQPWAGGIHALVMAPRQRPSARGTGISFHPPAQGVSWQVFPPDWITLQVGQGKGAADPPGGCHPAKSTQPPLCLCSVWPSHPWGNGNQALPGDLSLPGRGDPRKGVKPSVLRSHNCSLIFQP